MNREDQIRDAFRKHGTDKFQHNYAPVYADVPEDIDSILEIGVYWGRSLRAWLELFPQAHVYGLDINLGLLESPIDDSRCHLIEADIRSFDARCLPDFDLIIDDSTHELPDIFAAWEKFSTKCMSTYVIEDLYMDRARPVWDRIVTDFPDAQVILHRTSRCTGDERCPSGDSQCIKVLT